MKNLKMFLFTFFLFISIKKTVQSPSIDIKIIPDAYLNATAAFALFEDYQDSDYLYFSYDFDYHNKVNPKDLDQAYFKITTDHLYFNRELKHIILDKKQEEVTPADLDPKNDIIWNSCFLLSKLKVDNEYNYYIDIRRISAEKNTKKTVIIRIPVVKNNKGQIEIENLYTFPEEILGKKNLNQNFNSWPVKNDVDKYHSTELKPTNNYYHDYYLKNHYKYHYHHRTHCCYFSAFLGVILAQIWMVLFVLYFIVNRRKKTNLAVIINNAQNN